MRARNEIEIHMDHVMICGQRIERPSRICRSEWLIFWEALT